MKNDRLGANVLSMKVIPNVDPALAKELSLKPEHRSLGIVTSDCDDVTYVTVKVCMLAQQMLQPN